MPSPTHSDAGHDADPFVIARTYDAPRDVVWQAFTDAERMKHWWGPKGVTISTSSMDLRAGGTYHYCMVLADGSELWGRFVYREIAAPERVSSINSFSDKDGGLTRHPMAPTWPIETLSTVEFIEEGAGRTRFSVTWSPLNPTPIERATFAAGQASMRGGWTGTLDKSADYLARV